MGSVEVLVLFDDLSRVATTMMLWLGIKWLLRYERCGSDVWLPQDGRTFGRVLGTGLSRK